MRRLMILFIGMLLPLGILSPAAAKTGVRNHWTQLSNRQDVTATNDAHCDPCIRWTKQGEDGYYHGYWGHHLPSGAAPWFHTQAQAAIAEWGGQNYYSPLFEESYCRDLCIIVSDLGDDLCGVMGPSIDFETNLFTGAAVSLNNRSGVRYFDDETTRGCNIRWTYRHEVGHAFSEGHSSVSTNLMYRFDNAVQHIDADSRAELQAVYGAYGSNGTSGGCPCINGLKAKMLQLAKSLDGTPTLESATLYGL